MYTRVRIYHASNASFRARTSDALCRLTVTLRAATTSDEQRNVPWHRRQWQIRRESMSHRSSESDRPAAPCARLFCAGCSSSRRRCIHHLPLLVSRRHRRKAKRFRSVESPRRGRAFVSYRRAASRRSRHSPRARSSACHLTSPDEQPSIASRPHQSPCSSSAATNSCFSSPPTYHA